MMDCTYCKGEMVQSMVPFDVEQQGCHIHWNSLPAWVCTQCGEAYFEGGEVSRIQKVIAIIEREVPMQGAA
jgi:YgiT-type zinc finger domain-containing protein